MGSGYSSGPCQCNDHIVEDDVTTAPSDDVVLVNEKCEDNGCAVAYCKQVNLASGTSAPSAPKRGGKSGKDRAKSAFFSSAGLEDFQTESGQGGVLGFSSVGIVLRTRHRESQKLRAMKQISKKRLSIEDYKDELHLLRRVDHPHICRVHDMWEDPRSLYMVMDLCEGGDLMDLSASGSKLNESCFAVLTEQMVGAVTVLHQHDIVHSDLRPENWLFASSVTSESTILDLHLQMIDFGLASKHASKGRKQNSQQGGAVGVFHSHNGTSRHEADVVLEKMRRLFCRAPEQCVSNGRAPVQDEASKMDVWALGIIAYFMLSGRSPFSVASDSQLADTSYLNAQYVFMPTSVWRPVSSEAKNFIAMCLQRDPAKRPTASALLQLPWMQLARGVIDREAGSKLDKSLRGKLQMQDPPLPTAQRIVSSFERMRHMQLIERGAVMSTAFHMDDKHLALLWKGFERRDAAKTGLLSMQEILQELARFNTPVEDLTRLAEAQGIAGSCGLAYDEFLCSVKDIIANMQDNAVWEVFSRFEADREGRVPKDKLLKAVEAAEYRKSFAAKFPQVDLEAAVKDLTSWDDDGLEFDDFKQAFFFGASPSRQLS